MKLSPFHMELAKRIAQGQPNREIMKDIQVSGSRLSVLKANPLFQRQVEKYRRQEADAYVKALEHYGEEAVAVAQEMTAMAKNQLLDPKVRIQAAQDVLDRLGEASGATSKRQGDGQEVVFEQLLRVTRRAAGEPDSDEASEQPFDYDKAIAEIRQDVIDVTPVERSVENG